MKAAFRALIALCVVGLAPVVVGPAAVAQSQGSTPEIKVLSVGKAPREPLRFTAQAGTMQTSTMTLNFSIEQSGLSTSSVKAPPVRATIAATLQQVTPDGNLVVAISYTSFEALPGGGVSKSTRQAVEAALSQLAGVTGQLTLTTSGALVDSHIDIPAGLDPSLSQILNQLGDQLRALTIPFPTPAVGRGARWQAATDLEVNGIRAHQVYEYTLVKRRGATLELSIRGTQTAKPQDVEVPNAAPGIRLQLTRYRTTFRGTDTVDLNRMFPVKGNVQGSGNQTFRIEAGSEHGTLGQHIDVRVAVTPGGS